MKLIKVQGEIGWARHNSEDELIDLALIGEQAVGQWVLNFLGTAHSTLDETEAAQILKALAALESIQNGGGIGDAFADLEARAPRLPPHLEAARNDGKTTA